MNVPEAFEGALATIIRNNYDIGGETVIRCWQNLRADASWNTGANGDKSEQSIDIRSTPPAHGENETSNFTVTAEIQCRSKIEEDKDHAQIKLIYEGVQQALDDLYDQFRASETGDLLTEFKAAITALLGANYGLGNLSFGGPVAPWEEDGYNVISLSFVMDYSRL